MTQINRSAPAKVNLTLHVTGQRPDGYHLLDSLVVFTDVADQLTITSAPDLQIRVTGPFAAGVPTDHGNLVHRAAETLRRVRKVSMGAAIRLEKRLPHAAGIGGGSSDAAAALAGLAKLWKVAPLGASHPESLALGADVPVCMMAPGPLLMRGVGEVLAKAPALPDCALVLVNPGVRVPTADIFRSLARKDNPAMPDLPPRLGFADFAAWLSAQRNDLQPAAEALSPAIAQVLAKLRNMPQVACAGMSGSGATCFGVVNNMGTARQVARAIQVAEMGWWVAPAAVLQTTRATT